MVKNAIKLRARRQLITENWEVSQRETSTGKYHNVKLPLVHLTVKTVNNAQNKEEEEEDEEENQLTAVCNLSSTKFCKAA